MTWATVSKNQDEIKQETIAQGRVGLPQLPSATTASENPRIAILSRRKRLAHGGDLHKDFEVGSADPASSIWDFVKDLTIAQPGVCSTGYKIVGII